jgi:ADP-ribosylglycohydrolase
MKIPKRALSCLLALACGDSYGSAYETEGLAGARWPAASLPNMPVEPTVTDDTKMAVLLMEHYKRYGRLDIPMLTLSYRFWAKEEGHADGIGIQTVSVLLDGSRDKSSQGNGALMRSVPFGVWLTETGFGFEEAVARMNEDAAITHANEMVFLANRLALDIALHGIGAAEDMQYTPLVKKLYPGRTAWVVHTLFTVLEALRRGYSFLDGFKYIVSQGGDTDTNCAVFGALKGAGEDIEDELDMAAFLPKAFLQRMEKLSANK